MTVQCCCCHKVRSPKGWKTPGEADLAPRSVSHTYCPACYSELRTALDEWKRRHHRARPSS